MPPRIGQPVEPSVFAVDDRFLIVDEAREVGGGAPLLVSRPGGRRWELRALPR